MIETVGRGMKEVRGGQREAPWGLIDHKYLLIMNYIPGNGIDAGDVRMIPSQVGFLH